MLQRIPNPQQAPELLGALTDEHVALERACQHAQVLRPANKRRKIALGVVLAREARSDRTGPIVQHDGGVVESVTHGDGVGAMIKERGVELLPGGRERER